jgi:hypothetical protein
MRILNQLSNLQLFLKESARDPSSEAQTLTFRGINKLFRDIHANDTSALQLWSRGRFRVIGCEGSGGGVEWELLIVEIEV